MSSLELEPLEIPYNPVIRPKLSTHLVAAYLNKGHNMSSLARALGHTIQGVSDYVKRHKSELEPLLEPDSLVSIRYRAKAINILESINPKKIPDGQKAMSSGILLDKSRLLAGQSTGKLELDAVLLGVHARIFRTPPQDMVDTQDVVCVGNDTDNKDDADKPLINNDNQD